MNAKIKPFYISALRMKAGELMGVRDLAPDVADLIVPRFIVPPQGEKNNALQLQLFDGERFPDVSVALAAHWPKRDAFIEATYLIKEFGRDRMAFWLPQMFEKARKANTCPIPMVTSTELLRDDLSAYKSCLDTNAPLKLGIAFSSNDLDDTNVVNKALLSIETLGLSPNECLVIADFHDADFTNAALVTPVIAGVLETLQSSAVWQQIVFQGTNYPKFNPAPAGGSFLVPRNEWIAWRTAVRFEPATADHMIFGDYAADCAKIAFEAGGGAPAIRHYRYTTPDAWLVQRGGDEGAHAAVMRKVCEDILASGYFAGRDFSTADEFIFRTAHDAGGPGAAREWRAVNTTHHITRVVADIGIVRGFTPKRMAAEPLDRQARLY